MAYNYILDQNQISESAQKRGLKLLKRTVQRIVWDNDNFAIEKVKSGATIYQVADWVLDMYEGDEDAVEENAKGFALEGLDP